jgi:hypothetical protein
LTFETLLTSTRLIGIIDTNHPNYVAVPGSKVAELKVTVESARQKVEAALRELK